MTTVPTFEYRARNAAGRMVKGRVEAANASLAASKVAAMGVTPVDVRPYSATGLRMELEIPGFKKRVKAKDLAIMSRQMSTMVSAGLSIVSTLAILAEQTENPRLAKTLGEVRSDIEQGRGFSDSLARHPDVFPPLMVNLLRAGETGGFLDRSLDTVAVNFEKEVKLMGSIKSALTYPVIVLIISIVGVIGMLLFIVPVFKGMFESLGSQLPAPTQILVTLSEIMPILAPVLIVLIVAGTIWWRRNKRKDSVRAVVDPIRLRVPVFGKLQAKLAISRFSRNFAAMMGSGVPILRALSIVGETSGSYVIERAMTRVADSVRAGGSIAGPLATEPVFPSMVTQMIAVGENAGALEPMLDKIADFYDAEVESMTEQLTTLIEPLMIAFLGIVIGGMVVALYLPMFSLIGEVSGSG